MRSPLASIGKNLLLAGIAILSGLSLYFGWMNATELVAVQLMGGLGYICLSFYEYMNASYRASLPVQRYAYFSYRYAMTKGLKAGLFLLFAAALYIAGTKVQYLYPICLIIATTEACIALLKYRNSLCFVNIYANYLLFVEDRIMKVFASHIILIEFRHDIFYFIRKDRSAVQLNLEHIRDKEGFVHGLSDWINRNNVTLSAESRGKIRELIE
jgi:hypothetical protein